MVEGDREWHLARANAYLANAQSWITSYTSSGDKRKLESAITHIKTALSAVEKELDKLQ